MKKYKKIILYKFKKYWKELEYHNEKRSYRLKTEKNFSFLNPYLFASRNNREITFAEMRPFGLLNSPSFQDPLILLSCKRSGFTGASRLFHARKSRQFGQRIREKIREKSLHSSSALRRKISLLAKNRKKGERESRGVERRKAFFATWKTITGLERSSLFSLSLFLSVAVSTTGSFQLVSCGRDPSVESVESRRRRQLQCGRRFVA